MTDYILFMHEAPSAETGAWGPYLDRLSKSGFLRGGSAIGAGTCANITGLEVPVTSHITGFLRVEAESLSEVKRLLSGNPVYEAGGTVEIRELPRTDPPQQQTPAS